MQVLITGGAGFIGSHLAEALLDRDETVTVLDNLSTGSIGNIRRLQGHPRFSFTQGALKDGAALDRLAARADAIVHLAAAVGVHFVLQHPTATIETNVLGTYALLGAARRYRCRTLFASTSEVYGKGATLPFAEEDDLLLGPPSRSRWGYAASKLLDEFLVLAAHREFGLPVTIVRLFNVVGPRQTGRFGAVVPRFVNLALRSAPVTVYGDGAQTRCFCHVSDVVRALLGLLEEPLATSGEIYNVGSSCEVSIGDLARQVVARVGSASSIRNVPYDEAYEPGFEDMRRRVPDISKIKAATGWTPSLLLPDILDDMIEYERSRLAGTGWFGRDVNGA